MELPLLQLVFLVLLVALPIASKKVEHNLELFFLAMAVAGATLEGLWSHELLKEAFLHQPHKRYRARLVEGMYFVHEPIAPTWSS
jgi:predicted cation transporter